MLFFCLRICFLAENVKKKTQKFHCLGDISWFFSFLIITFRNSNQGAPPPFNDKTVKIEKKNQNNHVNFVLGLKTYKCFVLFSLFFWKHTWNVDIVCHIISKKFISNLFFDRDGTKSANSNLEYLFFFVFLCRLIFNIFVNSRTTLKSAC